MKEIIKKESVNFSLVPLYTSIGPKETAAAPGTGASSLGQIWKLNLVGGGPCTQKIKWSHFNFLSWCWSQTYSLFKNNSSNTVCPASSKEGATEIVYTILTNCIWEGSVQAHSEDKQLYSKLIIRKHKKGSKSVPFCLFYALHFEVTHTLWPM